MVNSETAQLSWCRQHRMNGHGCAPRKLFPETDRQLGISREGWGGAGSRESCRQGRLHINPQEHRAGFKCR